MSNIKYIVKNYYLRTVKYISIACKSAYYTLHSGRNKLIFWYSAKCIFVASPWHKMCSEELKIMFTN